MPLFSLREQGHTTLWGAHMAIERQELHCHNCGKYVQFDIDLSLNGNHVLECPNCKHEHCRVVKNGIITGDRWGSRNGPTINITASNATTSLDSTFLRYSETRNTADSTVIMMYDSWMNTCSNT